MRCRILLVEDEPLILMDLRFATEDAGCEALPARNLGDGMRLAGDAEISVAVLDVNLGGGTNCVPVAEILSRRGIPYLLHSGDLDRQDEVVRSLGAELIPKPAAAHRVIARALEKTGTC